MKTTRSRQNAKEAVLTEYPNAFVYDNGESVMILLREVITEQCPTCGRKRWKHEKPVHPLAPMPKCIGRAGSEEYAWGDAAKSLV